MFTLGEPMDLGEFTDLLPALVFCFRMLVFDIRLKGSGSSLLSVPLSSTEGSTAMISTSSIKPLMMSWVNN